MTVRSGFQCRLNRGDDHRIVRRHLGREPFNDPAIPANNKLLKVPQDLRLRIAVDSIALELFAERNLGQGGGRRLGRNQGGVERVLCFLSAMAAALRGEEQPSRRPVFLLG